MSVKIHRKDASAAPGYSPGGASALDDTGRMRATIARLDLGPDKEGDVYAGPQSFPVGKQVLISTWMHGSWEAGQLPVGVAKIYANASHVTAVGQLFRNTFAGEQVYQTLKALQASGKGSEFSFGYDVKKATFDNLPEGAKRRLDSIDVLEVSPVLVGAGNATRLEDLKGTDPEALKQQFVDTLVSMIHIDPRYARVAARLIGG
jgi:prohead serine protease